MICVSVGFVKSFLGERAGEVAQKDTEKLARERRDLRLERINGQPDGSARDRQARQRRGEDEAACR